ncbi:stimulus-sensing domain-containing protein [Fodinicurvata fenggangensis]|uniref:stimulus-sensing domain-containing protein n=1 Tax=Fodinicurvata fenggangensis TaxID=1121830 RepID=UPI0009DE75B2|nr:stimulus-sensing domain-containing protein [Fodinicurvata fenggangensis]
MAGFNLLSRKGADRHNETSGSPSEDAQRSAARRSTHKRRVREGQADYGSARSEEPDGESRTWRRPAWRSPLTRRILLLNVLVLLIPILGLLHLDQYRQSLIDSELEAMRTQGTTVALALGSAAVRDGSNGEQQLMHEAARQLIRVLLDDSQLRARLFSQDGNLIADSFLLGGSDSQVKVEELPPPADPGSSAVRSFGTLYDRIMRLFSGNQDLPLYRESPQQQQAEDYKEVLQALRGEEGTMARRDSGDQLILSVSVPVQRYRQVVGGLMVTKGGESVERAVRDRRSDILLVFAVALAVTVLLSFYLSHTIAAPIRRLARGAERIRGSKNKANLIPDLRARHDEIGDLSEALIDMTEALRARMEAIENFAADVAHEIKNPLTSLRSAVETANRIEDEDQRRRLMGIILDDVQRLDRLISEISDASRLDAELARAENERIDLGRLLDAMGELHKPLCEDKGLTFKVDVATEKSLVVTGLEGRLGQVFRNLLSNAISFSPEGGTIELKAWREEDRNLGPVVVATISDAGPGIPEGKQQAIFDRFYSERPREEKFGTHSGLGLSISLQIIEAHKGSLVAENRPEGGACFIVRLPAEE